MCKGMDKVSIIVPVKDEEIGLQYLINDYNQSGLGEKYDITFIFVIDERTSDDSRGFASKLSKNIIDQKGSTGKGDAIRRAILDLESHNPKFVIFLDADGSYSFESVALILKSLEDGSEVSSGSRFLDPNKKPKGMSRLHFFGNKILSRISSLKNRRKISDLCSGLWGFTYESTHKLDIKSSGFDLEAEIAGIITKNKLKHTEVRVKWNQRRGGESKLRSFKDGFVILLRILSYSQNA
jgi:glycosyltransferase involved in cell wall biosynthesis